MSGGAGRAVRGRGAGATGRNVSQFRPVGPELLLVTALRARQFIVCMHICAPSCLGPRAVAAELAITLLNRT